MRKIDKEEILIPLLEKYYPTERSFYESERIFYNKFENLIKGEQDLYLSKPFGISIIITNIVDANVADDLQNSMKKNIDNFVQTQYQQRDKNDKEIDEKIFKKGIEFSLKRNVFKSNNNIKIDIYNKNEEIVEFSLIFSLFISIASINTAGTELPHHIISFIFTTYITKNDGIIGDAYVNLSNNQIINLMDDKSNEFEQLRDIKKYDEIIKKYSEELLKIDKNTFLGLNFWRADWQSKVDNVFDVTDYVCENPYYFYSLLTLDKHVFRRNFKNIMDYLGWCFSASKVHCALFSRNAYISLTLKPLRERYEFIGHDGTEFRAWEVIALQNYLLYYMDIYYAKYKKSREGEVKGLVDELNKIYDFNAFLEKTGKGEIWIKFNTYLQDFIGINSYYMLYNDRYNRMIEQEEMEKGTKLTRLNLLLSSLIFTSIFLTIAVYLLTETKNNLHRVFVYNGFGDIITNILSSSFGLAIFVSALSILFILIIYTIYKLMKLSFNCIRCILDR